YFTVGIFFLMIGLFYLLIPVYGMIGAAWSATIVLVLYNILKLILLQNKIQMQPFSRAYLKILLAGVAALLAGYFLPDFSNVIIDIVLRSALIGLVYLILILWTKPSEELMEYLASIKKNKRLF